VSSAVVRFGCVAIARSARLIAFSSSCFVTFFTERELELDLRVRGAVAVAIVTSSFSGSSPGLFAWYV
jgi:hypothetical protein